MLVYTYGAITDKGDVRTENQDSIASLTAAVNGSPAAMCIVADGMGGLSYGSQVSQFIVSQFSRWWEHDFLQMMTAGKDSDEDIKELLEQEIWDINQAVLRFKEEAQCRTGSTLSVLLLYKERYYIKNIGDSRVYLFRDGKLSRLTEDQSLVAQMVREGRMTEEEAKYSKKKNVLTMCIGMFQIPQSYFATGMIYAGDQFIVCSDGFYNPSEDGMMVQILGQMDKSPQQKVEELREYIQPGLATDNVSVIIVEAEDTEDDDTVLMF